MFNSLELMDIFLKVHESTNFILVLAFLCINCIIFEFDYELHK